MLQIHVTIIDSVSTLNSIPVALILGGYIFCFAESVRFYYSTISEVSSSITSTHPQFAIQGDRNLVVYIPDPCIGFCRSWQANNVPSPYPGPARYHFFVHNDGYAYLLDDNYDYARFTTNPSISPTTDPTLYPAGTLTMTPRPTSQPVTSSPTTSSPTFQPTPSSDPNCDYGIISITGHEIDNACCAASCGICGGTGCSSRPGGAASCCATDISINGLSCNDNPAPCNIYPKSDPTSDPSEYPTRIPSNQPTASPTTLPPSDIPTTSPTLISNAPSLLPTITPSYIPTYTPSVTPSKHPAQVLTSKTPTKSPMSGIATLSTSAPIVATDGVTVSITSNPSSESIIQTDAIQSTLNAVRSDTDQSSFLSILYIFIIATIIVLIGIIFFGYFVYKHEKMNKEINGTMETKHNTGNDVKNIDLTSKGHQPPPIESNETGNDSTEELYDIVHVLANVPSNSGPTKIIGQMRGIDSEDSSSSSEWNTPMTVTTINPESDIQHTEIQEHVNAVNIVSSNQNVMPTPGTDDVVSRVMEKIESLDLTDNKQNLERPISEIQQNVVITSSLSCNP